MQDGDAGEGIALILSSSQNTGSGSTVLAITSAGTNNNPAAQINYGISSIVTKVMSNGIGDATNIAGYFAATGGQSNYAILVPSAGGSVGIGTISPSSLVTIVAVNATGNGVDVSSASLTTGNLMKLTSTSTVVNNGSLFNIASSGANSTASKTVNGATISVTNTGTTSTNYGLVITATGASTNYALKLVDGSQGLSKVLTSDANGNASWATPSSFALTNGSGTTANGTAVDLGGALTGTASIDIGGNQFYIGGDQPTSLSLDGSESILGDVNSHSNGIIVKLSPISWDIGDYNGGGLAGIGGDISFGTINILADQYTQFVSGMVGIGTIPTVALDVVGDVLFKTATYPSGLFSIVNGGIVALGDYNNDLNSTAITIDDDATSIFINATGGTTISGGNFIATGGTATINDLSGTGTRAVLADASGVLTAPVSDESVKENVQDLTYGITELMALRPVSYEFIEGWKNYGEGRQLGFIAQELNAVMPEATFITERTGKMGYNDKDLITLLVKSVQDLKNEIVDIKEQLKLK